MSSSMRRVSRLTPRSGPRATAPTLAAATCRIVSPHQSVEWAAAARRGQQRTFISDIISVLTNPAQTVKSLAETRRLLDEARQEIKDNSERSQIPRTHTFSPLPGFFPRPREIAALERALSGIPSFTVLFGASSVGKTALIRQVLSRPSFHVIHFDLRLAGFSSLPSLYFSLCNQMEAFFHGLATAEDMPGYEGFEKESWAFKHDRIDVMRRIGMMPMPGASGPPPGPLPPQQAEITTSDIARLLEHFQSSLLKYWEFIPEKPENFDAELTAKKKAKREADKAAAADKAAEESTSTSSDKNKTSEDEAPKPAPRIVKPKFSSSDAPPSQPTAPNQDPEMNAPLPLDRSAAAEARARKAEEEKVETEKQESEIAEEVKKEWPPAKKIPVFLLDEAHKLPALIQTEDAMKCILDALLVLTKQDRLIHCLHCTSDPFYMQWLRQMNIMQHCKLISVGDCGRSEAREFFEKHLLQHVPEEIRAGLNFDELYDVFGGKLAHWSDYITDYVNSDGALIVHKSTHFLQAHALLNLHLIHAQPPSPTSSPSPSDSTSASKSSGSNFRIYSPLRAGAPNSESSLPEQLTGDDPEAEFNASHLLGVMRRLAPPEKGSNGATTEEGGKNALSYFELCREMGARAVDGMVRGRILELRWSETVTPEWEEKEVNVERPKVSGGRRLRAISDGSETGEQKKVEEVTLPILVPTTPVVRYAMGEVVMEWERWAKDNPNGATTS